MQINFTHSRSGALTFENTSSGSPLTTVVVNSTHAASAIRLPRTHLTRTKPLPPLHRNRFTSDGSQMIANIHRVKKKKKKNVRPGSAEEIRRDVYFLGLTIRAHMIFLKTLQWRRFAIRPYCRSAAVQSFGCRWVFRTDRFRPSTAAVAENPRM